VAAVPVRGKTFPASVLCELGPQEFLGHLEGLLTIYASAMDADAASLPSRRELMRRHASYPDFRAWIAREHRTDDVVGFAYGFHGQTGQWWYDVVWAELARRAGMRDAAGWLANCMEIAEVHVRPQDQRLGIGTGLMLALTGARSEPTAVLSTPDRDSTARRLYRRMGFADLVTGFSFPGGSPHYAVMGAGLPLRDPAVAFASPSSW
jgi:ribosomal protein S18 acetylase RimI-like enzyme